MLALALALSLNLLSLIDLLWMAGILDNPYAARESVHPAHYVCAVLYLGFLGNSVLARWQIATAQRQPLRLPPRRPASNINAPRYLMASCAVFAVTLLIDLMFF
jgi:hypothetical protein